MLLRHPPPSTSLALRIVADCIAGQHSGCTDRCCMSVSHQGFGIMWTKHWCSRTSCMPVLPWCLLLLGVSGWMRAGGMPAPVGRCMGLVLLVGVCLLGALRAGVRPWCTCPFT